MLLAQQIFRHDAEFSRIRILDFKKRTDAITDSTQSYFAAFLKHVCGKDNTQALEATDAAYHCVTSVSFRGSDPGSKEIPIMMVGE